MRLGSRHTAALALASLLAPLPGGGTPQEPPPLAAKDVLSRVDDTLFPRSYTMEVTLTDHKPRLGERSFRIHLRGVRHTGSLLGFNAPPTEVGKRYLFRDRSIWISIPGLPNVVRVSAKEDFMDSSFANSDLMDTAYEDDYDSQVDAMGVAGGRTVYQLSCRARTERVTYASIKMVVDAATFIPQRFEYFTRSGLRTKAATFGAPRHLAGRLRPTRIEMRDDSLEGSWSVIEIERLEEAEVPPGALSVEALR